MLTGPPPKFNGARDIVVDTYTSRPSSRHVLPMRWSEADSALLNVIDT